MQDAKAKNAGRALASTSGVLKNMLKNTGSGDKNTAVIDEYSMPDMAASDVTTKKHHSTISWTQSKEEIEIRVRVPSIISKKDVEVKIRSNKLYVGLKSSKISITDEDTSLEESIILDDTSGANLFKTVDPDSSTWTLEKGNDGMLYVVTTLAKNKEEMWHQLVTHK